jgi:transcriptional regulator with XRE-family HTH domain
MDLNKKIEQIIVDKGMSPSFFADAIGVQRSSISHILSGRNKPSLDIIQKILRVFLISIEIGYFLTQKRPMITKP